MPTISRIKKRDGTIVHFDQNKITEAIWRAAKSVGGKDRELAQKISSQVCTVLEVFFKDENSLPTVEQIQDLVEKILIENGHAKTAKAYILYREEHQKDRQKKKEFLGHSKESKFPLPVLKVFQQYFLQRNEDNSLSETPEEMFLRVAEAVGVQTTNAEKKQPTELTKNFYDRLIHLNFIPESSILQYAGTKYPLIFGHTFIQTQDNLENIFETLKKVTLLYQTGNDVSIDFSNLRPRGDIIQSSSKPASGPGAFLKIFKNTLVALEQGAKKNAEYKNILRIDHPDIIEFLTAPEQEKRSHPFSSAIFITETFWRAFEENDEYDLIHPKSKKAINRLNARNVFDLVISTIHKHGQPMLVFEKNISQTTETEEISAYPRAYINLTACLSNGEFQWQNFQKIIQDAVNFLDRTLELSKHPFENIQNNVQDYRPIGLGIIGFADILIDLEISYGSEESLNLLREIIQTLHREVHKTSENLAKEFGAFPKFKETLGESGFKPQRNTIFINLDHTSILSKIAECTTHIEPLTDLVSIKQDFNGLENIQVYPKLEKKLQENNLLEKDMLRTLGQRGSLSGISHIPYPLQNLFITALDISPFMHLKFQANLEELGARVEKKIPLYDDLSLEELREICKTAYQMNLRHIQFEKVHHKRLKNHLFEAPTRQIALPFIEKISAENTASKKQEKRTEKIQNAPVNPVSKAQEITLPPIVSTN